jgi:ABC-type sugar transport system substrate-binding protein
MSRKITRRMFIKQSGVLAAGLVVAACAPTQPAAAPAANAEPTKAPAASTGEELKFGFSVAIMDNPYFIEVANGFKEQCAKNGVTAVVTDGKYDAALQNDQFENFIAMGCQAMGACPVDQKGLQAVVEKAKAKGIFVVSEAQKIDNADGHVIVDDYGYGVINGTNAAKWINHKLGGKAEVLLITLDHVEAVKLRGDGMADTIAKYCPNATIVARQWSDTMEKASNVTDTVLTAHPNLQVIACVNDQMALGALAAVQSKGIKDDNFYIGGADNTAEAVAKMNAPGSYLRVTTDIGPKQAGIDVAQMMYDHVKNGKPGETKYFAFTPNWQTGCGIDDSTPPTA